MYSLFESHKISLYRLHLLYARHTLAIYKILNVCVPRVLCVLKSEWEREDRENMSRQQMDKHKYMGASTNSAVASLAHDSKRRRWRQQQQ